CVIERGSRAVVDERVLVRARDEIDRSPAAAVAAAGTTARHTHLTAKGHAPVAAVTGLNLDVDFVDEHGEWIPVALLLLDGGDADDAAVRAVIGELHAPRDLREKRVVLAASDVQPRLEPAAALADEDRSAGHQVAVMALD